MNAFIQLYIASLKEFVRDRAALFWTIAFPLFFIILFGVIFSGNGDVNYNLGLSVEDEGPIGTQLNQTLDSTGLFTISSGSRDDLLGRFRNGELDAVLYVPSGVSAAAAAGQPSNLELYYDPSNQNNSQVLLSIIGEIVDNFERQVSGRPALLDLTPVSTSANNLSGIDFLLPGILSMSLMQLGLFATAPALVQLRTTQVLRRIAATPLPRLTLLASQVAYQLTIGLTQTVIIIAVGMLVFDVQIVGNIGFLVGFVVLGAVMFVAMGYLISGLAKTQESANGIAQLINFPMMFLSGIFFSVRFMPEWIQPFVNLMPLTYLADALRQLMVGGVPLFSLGVSAAVLGGWLVVCTIGAIRFFKWE